MGCAFTDNFCFDDAKTARNVLTPDGKQAIVVGSKAYGTILADKTFTTGRHFWVVKIVKTSESLISVVSGLLPCLLTSPPFHNFCLPICCCFCRAYALPMQRLIHPFPTSRHVSAQRSL
jgi:hypothetical protein